MGGETEVDADADTAADGLSLDVAALAGAWRQNAKAPDAIAIIALRWTAPRCLTRRAGVCRVAALRFVPCVRPYAESRNRIVFKLDTKIIKLCYCRARRCSITIKPDHAKHDYK